MLSRSGSGADFPLGISFELILEAIDGDVNLVDADPILRAIILGMTFGMQLGAERNVTDWPVRSAFRR